MNNETTIWKGERTEAVLLAEFTKRGQVVLLPFGNNQRYDMVLNRDTTFITVQCKTARIRRGCVVFSTCSSSHPRGQKHQNYRGQVDMFGVYCPELDKVYLVPVHDVGIDKGYLRIEPTKNNQDKTVKWASEYEI